MTTLSKSAFAKSNNWAPSYVTKLIGLGRIVLTEDGKRVQVEESLKRIAETQGGRADVAERNASERKQRAKGDTPHVGVDIPIDHLPDGSRSKYKALAMHFENQLAKLNMSLERGMHYRLDDVRDEALGIGNTLRAAMERLIDTTAPRIAIATTREERARILQLEINALRKTMRHAFPRAMIRLAKKKHG